MHPSPKPPLAATPVLPEGANHRRAERLPLERAARLVFADLSRAIDVTLRDISWEGVRVTSPASVDLPRDVYLLVADTGRDGLLRLACETRWQVGNAAGLRFSGAAETPAIAALLATAAPAASPLQQIFGRLPGRQPGAAPSAD